MVFDSDESGLRDIIKIIVQVITAVAFAWFLVYCFGAPQTASGQSMRPAIEAGDRLLLDRMSYHLKKAGRYDIVLFTTSENGNPNIKRIVGLPGERVQIRDGHILINGKVLEKPVELELSAVSIGGIAENEITLAENEYFVLGDNRDAGEDSRSESIGSIPAERLMGKLWFRVGPFERIGRIR